MGAGVFFFLLFAVMLMICTPREERGLALGSMAVVGAAILLLIRLHIHSEVGSFVGAVVELAWRYREETLMAFGIGVVMIVPLLMIYVGLRDREDLRRERSLRQCEAARHNKGSRTR
jgi:MFS family permease